MLFQQLTTPSSYPKESGGPFTACPLEKPVCPSRWPYWTCSKRIHPLNQWLSLSPSIRVTNWPTQGEHNILTHELSPKQSDSLSLILRTSWSEVRTPVHYALFTAGDLHQALSRPAETFHQAWGKRQTPCSHLGWQWGFTAQQLSSKKNFQVQKSNLKSFDEDEVFL